MTNEQIEKAIAAIKGLKRSEAPFKAKKQTHKVGQYSKDKQYEIKMRRWAQEIMREGF